MFALSLALAATLAAAQASTPPLTLDAAVDEALVHNARLAAERAAVAPLRQRPAQAEALPPPMLEAQIWRWPLTSINPADVDMYMFSGRQDLPARGWREAAAAAARREADAAEQAVSVTASDTAEAVAVAYASLHVARRSREVYASTLDALRALGDASVARYETATLGQGDVLKVVVELSRLEQDLIDLDERERQAEVDLAVLLGRDPGHPIEALAPPAPPPAALDGARLAAAAEAQVPELRAADARLAAAEARRDLAALERKPTWSVSGGYMLMPGSAGAWSAGIGLSWPEAPWSRGRLEALEAERSAEVRAEQARLTALRQDVRAGVEHALASVRAARARVDLLRTTVLPQAEQTLEVSRIGYGAGQVAFLDVIDNQRVELAATLDLIRAEGLVLTAAARLERAVGAPLGAPAAIAALTAAREQ
ncbi:MAG: TolC family protein [Vicinamibacterales bacterium]